MPVHKHPIAMQNASDPLVNIPLDHALIARLRASYSIVREHDLKLAEIFYSKLFAAAPPLRQLFHTDPQVQARKLISTLDAIVENLSQPHKNLASLALLGKRHVEYGAKPEHYSLVVEVLVASMGELLGSRAEPHVLHEWRTALTLISEQMIAAAKSAG